MLERPFLGKRETQLAKGAAACAAAADQLAV